MNSELKFWLGLAKVRLVILVALVSRIPLATSIGSLVIVMTSEASIVCRCLDLKLRLKQIVGLWSLNDVEIILVLVDVEEHCSDGQEPVQLNAFDYLRICKYLLVKESNYEGRAKPILFGDQSAQPSEE